MTHSNSVTETMSTKNLLTLNEIYLLTLKVLLKVIESRDTLGSGHAERVSKYSKQIAKKLKLFT